MWYHDRIMNNDIMKSLMNVKRSGWSLKLCCSVYATPQNPTKNRKVRLYLSRLTCNALINKCLVRSICIKALWLWSSCDWLHSRAIVVRSDSCKGLWNYTQWQQIRSHAILLQVAFNKQSFLLCGHDYIFIFIYRILLYLIGLNILWPCNIYFLCSLIKSLP